MKRTLQTIDSSLQKQSLSVKKKPLIRVEPDNVVVDELHLLLRILDRLLKNIVDLMLDQDKKTNFRKTASSSENHNIRKLEHSILDLGVTFRVWEKMNGDGSGSGLHDFTSLNGDDKKKVLKGLPKCFETLIDDKDNAHRVLKLWTEFEAIYRILTDLKPTDDATDNFFGQATNWISTFLTLGDKMPGFHKRNVTPYMHMMCYHIPLMLQKHRNIKEFSGQLVEKKNDLRKTYNLKSSHYDSCYEALAACKRLEALGRYRRQPREYPQRSESQNAKKRSIKTVGVEVRDDTKATIKRKAVLLSRSTEELKQDLAKKNVKTKCRKHKLLVELLLDSENKENKNKVNEEQ